MSTSPGSWIELISRYGPVALFVFMVFVLLGMARATKGLSDQQKKVQNFAFGFVWVSIFVLAVMIVVSWWQGNFPKEFVVRGTISGLTYPMTITTYQPVYLHRRPVAALDFDYDWRFISSNRYTGSVELLLQKGSGSAQGAGGTTVLKYKMQIQEDFYKNTVDIDYDSESDVMVLRHGQVTEKIAPTHATFATDAPESAHLGPYSALDVVYASTKKEPKPEDLIGALDVDDPLIRTSARQSLIALGVRAVPYLENALVDPASSYRLRVGILSTLKDMGSANQSLGQPARCAIVKAGSDRDPTLSAEAAHVIATGIALPKDCTAQAPNPRGRLLKPVAISQGAASGLYVASEDGVITVLNELPSGLTERRHFLLPGVAVPFDIASSEQTDSVFVCAAKPGGRNPSILHLSAAGKLLHSWLVRRACSGITYDPSGHTVYFGDLNTNELSKIDLEKGSGPKYVGGVRYAQQLGALAFDSVRRRIFVTDSWSQGVYEYDLNTKKSSSVVQKVGNISALHFDAEKNLLYIADSSHRRIVVAKMDETPPSINTFSQDAAFRELSGLAIVANGLLAVSDSSAQAIFLLSSDGRIASKYP
jgi:hypothetical protein